MSIDIRAIIVGGEKVRHTLCDTISTYLSNAENIISISHIATYKVESSDIDVQVSLSLEIDFIGEEQPSTTQHNIICMFNSRDCRNSLEIGRL